jgi:cytochrome c556
MKTACVLVLLAACDRSPGPAPGPANAGDSWIRGDVDQRFAIVARQLRGFDVAMVETGYRYGELYWAGQDRNWDFATYQLEKIETAIASGLERRPKRAASAAMLAPAVERVRGAVARKDAAAFAEAFATLTQTCNACHVAEKMAFVHVVPPVQRVSPVRVPAPEVSP